MAKKFLGLSMFYWLLIVLVVLFFVYGGKKVSEGFTSGNVCLTENKTKKTKDNMKQCFTNPNKCRWASDACYCCP